MPIGGIFYRANSYIMIITMKGLRRLIAEALAGSDPVEAYDKALVDDPAFAQASVYVPDDIKDDIKDWQREMGLDGHTRSR